MSIFTQIDTHHQKALGKSRGVHPRDPCLHSSVHINTRPLPLTSADSTGRRGLCEKVKRERERKRERGVIHQLLLNSTSFAF